MAIKLSELVNSFGSSIREVTNFVRYPIQNISQIVMRRVQNEYENIEFPLNNSNHNREELSQKATSIALATTQGNSGQKVSSRRVDSNTVNSKITEKKRGVSTSLPERLAKRKYRGTETIPILPKEREIRGGRRGRYRVEALLKDSERVRLYQGIQVLNSKPVLIKEYLLLEQDFNQKEARERKEKFERIATLNLKNGGGQDFRLISPWDAIAPPTEKRCYLIFESLPNNSSTLRDYLANNGAMTTQQVRQVLYQVLQTLWFLHTQRLPISHDEIRQGISHGNLSLDSILIATNLPPNTLNEPQFFIYLTDLVLWEDLFQSPTLKPINYSVEKDLKDLGYVSFYLLSGGTVDPIFNQPLDPNFEDNWPEVNDTTLKNFIYRLLGISQNFKTALEARQALLAPQLIDQKSSSEVNSETKEQIKNYSAWQILLTLVILGIILIFLAQVIMLCLRLLTPGKFSVLTMQTSAEVCCLRKVDDVPNGLVEYITEPDGIWSYILRNNSLVSYKKTLMQELQSRDPRLANYQLRNDFNVINSVQSGSSKFALTTYVENLPDDLEQEVVAYDGLVVFVAFSDNQRQRSIPTAFNGKITLEQLRELYTTGTLKDWSIPKGLKNNIKVYMPMDNPKTLQLFEQLAFNGSPPPQFQQLRDRQNIDADTPYILGAILKDFEDYQTVSFGFGLLSRVFNQCSVYPLAVGEKNHEVQPLVQRVDNQLKPLDPTINLCNDKGSYIPNLEAFKSGQYPLMYRLVVVYSKDEKRGVAGRKFAELLKTDEGQLLLNGSGLVPLRKLPINN
ncbi:substrate-binding domain-containing protein [Aerosakkonemataceae cyanobacterium BLCC-F50]|uniref:Substrate-binding domain-containing protein n=1 Tax=Floridaenema flaviceps BLCC-F50 TaxID=3153642 RepID=A0ABV4XJ64_9CYAN